MRWYAGNAAILKGGKDSTETTRLLSKAIQTALSKTAISSTYIQAIQTRAEVPALLDLDQYIDLVIPHGSNSLVRNIQNNTRIPVMGHAGGLCSVYVGESADVKKAARIVMDPKIQQTILPPAAQRKPSFIMKRSFQPSGQQSPEPSSQQTSSHSATSRLLPPSVPSHPPPQRCLRTSSLPHPTHTRPNTHTWTPS
ncbi:ALDH-like protein [Pilatotrama ljubarskyi]|nr:ALDH-like protein [Pilatotrama ljubarskyi]